MNEPAGQLLYNIVIRENATGKMVKYEDSYPYWDDQESRHSSLRFMFEDGNYSCDCNRKLFFGRAYLTEFSDEETPCGHSKYSVKITLMDGTVVLDELETA